MQEEEREQTGIFPDVFKAVSQDVHVAAENCPLVECVAMTADPIDSQEDIPERVLQSTSLTDKDWPWTQQQTPTLNLAIQYLKSGARKLASQTRPFYDANYLKDWDKLYLQDGIL